MKLSFQKAFLYSLVGIISVFIFIELTTRIVYKIIKDEPIFSKSGAATLFMDHPYLPTIPRPGAKFGIFRVNNIGLRGPDTTWTKPQGTYRILLLGGSSTWGIGPSEENKNWPCILQNILAAKSTTKNVEVLNLGVPGYTTVESLIQLALIGISLSPDIIVIVHGYNDWKPGSTPGFKTDYSHWRTREKTWIQCISTYSRFIEKISAHISYLSADLKLKSGKKLLDSVPEEAIISFERNLISTVALGKTISADAVLVTFPSCLNATNLNNNPHRFARLISYTPFLSIKGMIVSQEQYNNATRHAAQITHSILADASSLLPQDPSLFIDHCHFNDAGAKEFARFLAPYILIP